MTTLSRRYEKPRLFAGIGARYQQFARGLSRNVQLLVASEPLWAVPVNWTKTYASIFMAALGLSAVQIGWMTSLTLIMQMAVSPFGGYVADRFGRKRSLIFFDTLSWVIPMFLWMVSGNIWYFVVAALLNGLNTIVWPAWNCLLVEDTDPSRRSTVFAAFQLVVLGAGILSPIAGWVVKGYDIIIGPRILYAIAGISIGVMVAFRAYVISETSVGSSRVAEVRGMRVREYLAGYKEILREGRRNHVLIMLFFLGVINSAYITIWAVYSSLYMTHAKGLNLEPSFVAMWPTFLSVVMIAVLLFVLPRVRLEHLAHWLVFSLILLCGGMFLFIFAPQGSYATLALAAVLIGTGTALVNPLRDTFLSNVMDDRQRAALLAAMNSLGMALIVPLTPLSGWLFELSPRAPLLLLEVLFAIGVLLAVGLRKIGNNPAVEVK